MDLSRHRKFYVDTKLEFARLLPRDKVSVSAEKIKEEFFNSRDWISQAKCCGWVVKRVEISEDLMEVYIFTK